MIQYTYIIDILKKNGIDAYAPGAHAGNVKKPYVVVKPMTESKYLSYSTTICYYDLLIYARTMTELLEAKSKVKKIMEDAEPMIMPTYDTDAPYYDEDVRGFMVSIMYRNYKQIVR